MKLTRQDQVQFLEQLSTMLQAGVSLQEALEALCHSVNLDQAELAQAVSKDLHEGKRLSSCFARFEEHFDPVFIGTIYSAEECGGLVRAMQLLTEQMQEGDRTRRAFLSSLTYPLVQLLITFLMVGFLLYYMLPRFLPFFVATGEALPPLTQAVWDLSQSWIVKLFPFVAVFLGAVAFRAWSNRAFRQKLVRLSFYIPKVGPLLYRHCLANCCEQLALQLDSGLLFDSALKSSARCSPFPPLSRVFLRLRKGVREGESLSELVVQEALIPDILAICICVGDETARMPEMLRLASRVIRERVEVKKDAFLQLVEPILLMVMGFSVGIIVLACFLPVYHLATASL